MWQTERDFSRYILQRLKGASCETFRIETGSTAVGIPDAYVLLFGTDLFIEFKNNKRCKITSDHYNVPWRPAQKVFATKYRMYNAERITIYNYSLMIKKNVLTLMGVEDGFLIIRMNMNRCGKNSNIVLSNDCDVYRYTMKEIVDCMPFKFPRLLKMIAEFPVAYHFYPEETVLSYCFRIVDYYCWRECITSMTKVEKERLIEEAIEEAQLLYGAHIMDSVEDTKHVILIHNDDGIDTETKYSYIYNITSAIINKFIKIKLFS